MENKGVGLLSGGLRFKILRLCVFLVVFAVSVFAIIVVLQLRSLFRSSEKAGAKSADLIKEVSSRYVRNSVEQRLLTNAGYAAELIDGQFWTFAHDYDLLAAQVEDVFRHPKQYKETPVFRPDRKNDGQYTLQLILSDPKRDPDPETYSMLRRLANLEPMMEEIIRGNRGILVDCYIALPDGSLLTLDAYSAAKFDEDGKLLPFDGRSRPWYKNAVKEGDISYTLTRHSYFSNVPEMVFGVPVYVNGRLVAVLEGCCLLSELQEGVQSFAGEEGEIPVLIGSDGLILYSPIQSGDLAMNEELTARVQDIRDEKLKTLVNHALDGEDGFSKIDLNGKSYFVAYKPIESIGGTAMIFIPKRAAQRLSNALVKETNKITEGMLAEYAKSFRMSTILSLLVVILLIANAVLSATIFSGKLLKPITVMTNRVKELTAGDSFVFEMDDAYRTGDEIEVLAETFGELSERTRGYIKEIMEVTAEKERIGAELNVATRIQADMLPGNFPLFPDRTEFDLYASMTPAKEVGGDFYDVFFVDYDHLCVVMGDVSGKGVPAALFMVISKTMLKNRAQMGGRPSEILFDVNNSLCEGNKEMMFVTAWMGILSLSTGEMAMANAGHEYPVVRRKEKEYEEYQDEHGFVLGGMRNMKYTDTMLSLAAGDEVFVYTDGLPEATDAQGKRFETKRMLEALNTHQGDSPETLLRHVAEDVKRFVGDAPRFDDLTMLAFCYNGPEG